MSCLKPPAETTCSWYVIPTWCAVWVVGLSFIKKQYINNKRRDTLNKTVRAVNHNWEFSYHPPSREVAPQLDKRQLRADQLTAPVLDVTPSGSAQLGFTALWAEMAWVPISVLIWHSSLCPLVAFAAVKEVAWVEMTGQTGGSSPQIQLWVRAARCSERLWLCIRALSLQFRQINLDVSISRVNARLICSLYAKGVTPTIFLRVAQLHSELLKVIYFLMPYTCPFCFQTYISLWY